MSLDPSDSRHGTPAGNAAGCRASDTCPATPSCTEARNARARERHANRDADSEGQAMTRNVQKRLEQTIATAGYENTVLRIGLSVQEVEAMRTRLSSTVSYDVAEKFDQAWSFLVHGFDTLAPTFKHGDGNTSYNNRKCRCRVCAKSRWQHQKKREAGIITEHTVVTDPRIQKVARRLLDAGPAYAVADAAGINDEVVRKARDGRPIEAVCVRALLATTPEQVKRAMRAHRSDETYARIQKMRALGYNLSWQARETGYTPQAVARVKPGVRLWVKMVNAFEDLYARVGEHPANPDEHGIDPKQIERACKEARALGFYPPACYDENGNLDPRSIHDHPWSKLDERAARYLEAAHLMCQGIPQTPVSARVGVSDKTVQRLNKALGLTYGITEQAKSQRLDYVASARALARFHTVHDGYLDGTVGPVEAALRLGFIDVANLNQRTQLNHPEVAAFTAARTIALARHNAAVIAALVARTSVREARVAA